MKSAPLLARTLVTSGQARRLAAVVAGVLVLTACGASSGSGDGASSADDVAAAQARIDEAMKPIENVALDLEPLGDGAADLSDTTVLIVPASATLFGVWVGILEDVLESLGADVSVCDGKALPTEIAACMENAPTVYEADAVLTIAVSPSLVANAYQTLADEEVPVLSAWQNPGDVESSDLLRFTDSTPANEASGKLGIDYILANVDSPNLLDIGLKDNPQVVEVSDNVATWFTDHCAGCTITSERITAAEAVQAASLTSSQFLTDPNLNAISAFNLDGQGSAIVDGLRTANKSVDDVAVCGKAGGMAALQLLKEGKVTCVVQISTNYLSWVAVDALLRLLDGKEEAEYPQVMRVFDATNVDDLEITPAKAGTFDWFGTATYETSFKESWGVS